MKALIVVYALIVILGLTGWVMNIIEIAHASSFTVMVALRCIGILVAPLGAVLGYL